jgi:hypothetical protein
MKYTSATLLILAASCGFSADDPASFTRLIPSQNGFAVDYGKHGPGDVLTLTVNPDPGCTITQKVKNPTPLGWVAGFTLTIPDNAAGVHTGTFGGTYACGNGSGPGPSVPPEWNGSATVDACKEVIKSRDIPVVLTLDDKFAWLKDIQTVIQRIPIVKRASVELSFGATKAIGSECCKGRSDRTDFAEFEGTGEGEIDVILAWGVPRIGLPTWKIPIPTLDYNAVVAAAMEFGLNGGGKAAIKAGVGGRLGECSCTKYSGSFTVTPVFRFVAEGLAGVNILHKNTSEVRWSFEALEINGEASLQTTIQAEGAYYDGTNCPEASGRATISYPQFVVSLGIHAFWIVDIDWEEDLTSYVYDALGVTDPVVQIWP